MKGIEYAMIVLGMALKGADLSRLATDAMIQGISNGQIDGPSLGPAFVLIYRTTPVKILRWIKALNVCLHVGPLHAQVARLALESLLDVVEEMPIPGLELLNELVASSGDSIANASLEKKLAQLPGTGKAVKLAKEILRAKNDSAEHRISTGT
jgi:hypothetical protein